MIRLPGESRYATVAGIKTHYVALGAGPPLILIHGLGASVMTCRDNLGPLSKAFQVYTLDLPGHGDSEKSGIDYVADRMVRFMISFTEELGLERPAIIGSSVGGALGHPELVSKLVLVDSAGLGREISVYLRLVSIPELGKILESSKVSGTRLMLYNVFYDRVFVTPELLDELFRTREISGAKEAVIRVIRNSVGLGGKR